MSNDTTPFSPTLSDLGISCDQFSRRRPRHGLRLVGVLQDTNQNDTLNASESRKQIAKAVGMGRNRYTRVSNDIHPLRPRSRKPAAVAAGLLER